MGWDDGYRRVVGAQRAISEAVAALDAMPEGYCEEIGHSQADDILCECLRKLGAPEVADAFERARSRVGFWYA
jgi:hypothetical protein